MRFIHRNRRALSVLTLTAFMLGGTITPATAYYHPALGRYMSADPNGQGIVLLQNLPYHARNPVVTVNKAYTLQYGDGMNFYEYLRSNPARGNDPSGMFLLLDTLNNASLSAYVRAEMFAAAHPMAMRVVGGLLAAANLYAFAQYQEIQAFVMSQPNPSGFVAGEMTAVGMAIRDVLSAGGSAMGLRNASSATLSVLSTAEAAMPLVVAQEQVVTVRISRTRWPEAAAHIEQAQAAGQPRVLTIDRAGIPTRRAAAQRGTPRVTGLDLDEYPPAMFKEGGAGASVRPINPSDNGGAGASMGNQLRPFLDGTKVLIEVIP